MIKFEHSVFALPFALTGALLAFRESRFATREFGLKLLWIVVAMVGARSAAMAFNRILDADIDARNPRTRMRHIPAGFLSARFRLGLYRRCSIGVPAGGARVESAVFETGAAGAGRRLLLFVHQALYVLLAPGPRIFARDRAGGGVDCGPGIARSAHSLAHRRSDVLDRRVRHHLFMPGF